MNKGMYINFDFLKYLIYMFWIVIKQFSIENYIYTNSFENKMILKTLSPCDHGQLCNHFSLAEITFIMPIIIFKCISTKPFSFQHKGIFD